MKPTPSFGNKMPSLHCSFQLEWLTFLLVCFDGNWYQTALPHGYLIVRVPLSANECTALTIVKRRQIANYLREPKNLKTNRMRCSWVGTPFSCHKNRKYVVQVARGVVDKIVNCCKMHSYMQKIFLPPEWDWNHIFKCVFITTTKMEVIT